MAKGKGHAYIDLNERLTNEVALLATQYPNEFSTQWNKKWELLAKLNAAWDKLSKAERKIVIGLREVDIMVGEKMNESIARTRAYNAQIDRGVYGRDLIQPLDEKGNPNPDFVERYGVANYTEAHKEYIKQKMGRDPHREKDWRSKS